MVQSSALIRTTLFVEDLEVSTRFYRSLGLDEVYYEGLLDDPSASTILGFEEHWPYQVRILKRPGPNFGMIGLFTLDPRHPAEGIPPGDGPARRGEAALVFYVPSVAQTVSALRGLGARWCGQPHVFRLPHRAQTEICLRDPDGFLINLVETDPEEQNLTQREGLSAQR